MGCCGGGQAKPRPADRDAAPTAVARGARGTPPPRGASPRQAPGRAGRGPAGSPGGVEGRRQAGRISPTQASGSRPARAARAAEYPKAGIRSKDDCRNMLRETQALMHKQCNQKGARECHPKAEWDKDKWPWPWLYAEPPSLPGKRPGEMNWKPKDYYSAYLKTFRILSAAEADAYAAWKDGDKDTAKAILDDTTAGIRRQSESAAKEEHATQASGLSREASMLSPHDREEASPESADMMIADMSNAYEKQGKAGRQVIVNKQVDVNNYQLPVHTKSDADRRVLVKALQQSPLFSHLVREKEYMRIADAMRPVSYNAGVNVFDVDAVMRMVADRSGSVEKKEPDPGKQGLWCIVDGEVEYRASGGGEGMGSSRVADPRPMHKSSSMSVMIKKSQTGRGVLRAGQLFGEQLVCDCSSFPQDVAMTVGAVRGFCLSNEDYLGVMAWQANEKRQQYLKWLKQNEEIPLHKVLNKRELLQFADSLKETKYAPGEKIIVYGEQGNACHFIVEGEVKVFGREKLPDGRADPSRPVHVCSFQPGHAVGFLEFFQQPPGINIADVAAGDDAVITARIGADDFSAFVEAGPVKDELKKMLDQREDYAYARDRIPATGSK